MIKIVVLIIVIVIIAGSAFFVLPKIIAINSITCSNQVGPCSQEIQNKLASNFQKGSSLKETRERLAAVLNEQSGLSVFSIRFDAPDSVRIFVAEKQAAVMFIEPGNVVLVFDSKGDILGSSATEELPTVEVLGSNISDEQRKFALKLMVGLAEAHDSRVAQITSRGFETRIDGLNVVFPLSGEIDTHLGALRLILSRLNSEHEKSRIDEIGVTVTEIDLRFVNPVLR